MKQIKALTEKVMNWDKNQVDLFLKAGQHAPEGSELDKKLFIIEIESIFILNSDSKTVNDLYNL